MSRQNDNRFKDLDELIDAIELGLDIEFDLYGARYYIGAPSGTLILSWNNGNNEVKFDNIEQLLGYKINGRPLKEIYQDMEIYNM